MLLSPSLDFKLFQGKNYFAIPGTTCLPMPLIPEPTVPLSITPGAKLSCLYNFLRDPFTMGISRVSEKFTHFSGEG